MIHISQKEKKIKKKKEMDLFLFEKFSKKERKKLLLF
jgi:hypothetical protein